MTADITKLREALERVEAATGPDRDLDSAIWAAIAESMLRKNDPSERKAFVDAIICNDKLTGSLDAVVALIEREHGTGVPIQIHIAAHWCEAFVGWGLNRKGECRRRDRQIALAVLWSYLQALIAEAEQREDVA